MAEVPINLDYDSKVQRLKRRYQGLSRVAASINDLYIYGVYPSNFPNLTVVLEETFDSEEKATEGTEPLSQEVKEMEIKIENTKWRKNG